MVPLTLKNTLLLKRWFIDTDTHTNILRVVVHSLLIVQVNRGLIFWPFLFILPNKTLQWHRSDHTNVIGVAPIMQLRMCVIKIVMFKGGHPMW